MQDQKAVTDQSSYESIGSIIFSNELDIITISEKLTELSQQESSETSELSTIIDWLNQAKSIDQILNPSDGYEQILSSLMIHDRWCGPLTISHDNHDNSSTVKTAERSQDSAETDSLSSPHSSSDIDSNSDNHNSVNINSTTLSSTRSNNSESMEQHLETNHSNSAISKLTKANSMLQGVIKPLDQPQEDPTGKKQSAKLFKMDVLRQYSTPIPTTNIFDSLSEPYIITDSSLYLLSSNKVSKDILLKIVPTIFEKQNSPISLDDLLELSDVDKKKASRLSDLVHLRIKEKNKNRTISTTAKIDSELKINVTFNPLDESNQNNTLCISLQDVTDHYRIQNALTYKESLFDLILNNSKDAVIVHNETGDIELFSPTAEQIFGFDAIQMMIENVSILFPDEEWKKIEEITHTLEDNKQSSIKTVLEQVYGIRANGETFPVSLTLCKTKLQNRDVFIITASDNTSFHTFINSVNDCYLRLNHNGHIIDWNSLSEKVFDLDFYNSDTKRIEDLNIRFKSKNPNNPEALNYVTFDDVIDANKRNKLHTLSELYSEKVNGSSMILTLTIWPQLTSVGNHFNILIKDITTEKKNEARLKYYAYFDGLTKLSNRTSFKNKLDNLIRRYSETQQTFALLFLDLDKFKFVNDSFGHKAGDDLLIKSSHRIKQCVREKDIVSRLGGDEFTVIIDRPENKAIVESIAQRINTSLSKEFHIFGKSIHISVSIGITYFPEHGTTLDDLMTSADIAMYHSKESGRNSYKTYDENIRENYDRRAYLENQLKKGAQNNDFFLEFQPKVCVDNNTVFGVEALLRWRLHEKLISPGEFIPIAEESDLILDISRWVFNASIAQMTEWINNKTFGDHKITMSINVSTLHFKRGLYEDLLCCILTYDIDPTLLEIEITESALVEDIVACSDILKRISQTGVNISVDDFGTGYSSLRYLVGLPIDTLKVDRAFICDIASNKKSANLVSAIISMAKGLDMSVIIEGVEDSDQLDTLKALNVTKIQGFFYSRPLPNEKLIKYINNHKPKRQVSP